MSGEQSDIRQFDGPPKLLRKGMRVAPNRSSA